MNKKVIKPTPFGSVCIIWSVSKGSPRIIHVLLSRPELSAEKRAMMLSWRGKCWVPSGCCWFIDLPCISSIGFARPARDSARQGQRLRTCSGACGRTRWSTGGGQRSGGKSVSYYSALSQDNPCQFSSWRLWERNWNEAGVAGNGRDSIWWGRKDSWQAIALFPNIKS